MAICTLSSTGSTFAGLTEYDAAIAADHAADLPYTSMLADSEPVFFDSSNGEPFDFGAVSGSSTIEFILSGDPVAGGRASYLAVGSNTTYNLRYENWDDTGQMGFTHLGLADYLFDPAVESPNELTHVTYVVGC